METDTLLELKACSEFSCACGAFIFHTPTRCPWAHCFYLMENLIHRSSVHSQRPSPSPEEPRWIEDASSILALNLVIDASWRWFGIREYSSMATRRAKCRTLSSCKTPYAVILTRGYRFCRARTEPSRSGKPLSVYLRPHTLTPLPLVDSTSIVEH